MLTSLTIKEINSLIKVAEFWESSLESSLDNEETQDNESSMSMRERKARAIKSEISHLNTAALAELAALLELGRNGIEKKRFRSLVDYQMTRNKETIIDDFSQMASIPHYLSIGLRIIN